MPTRREPLPSRGTSTARSARAAREPAELLTRTGVQVLGIDLGTRVRFPVEDAVLDAGVVPEGWVRLTTKDANRLLREVARLVADLPAGPDRSVVWQAGSHELLVHTDRLGVSIAPGLVTIGVPVECDQVPQGATVSVPLAVGTDTQPRALFMSTFSTPDGPAEVTAAWSEALVAFAWECLVTLAQHVAAASGKDRRGRALVPVAVSAAKGALLVKPMARSEA